MHRMRNDIIRRKVRIPLVSGALFAALVGHSKGTVTSKYIHSLDTALIMAADTISGYVQGLLDGVKFKQTAYAVDRNSRKAALSHFLKKAVEDPSGNGQDLPLAA